MPGEIFPPADGFLMNRKFALKNSVNYSAVIFSLFIFFSFNGKEPGSPSKTIIIIPYQRTMHISDADADIAEVSRLSVRQVRLLLRASVSEKISFAIRDNFGVRLLTEMGAAREKDDLGNFYDSENFVLSKLESESSAATADTAPGSNPYFSIFKKNNSADYNSSYMNVSMSKPVLLQKLANDYEADYFLVMTQLEIKTNYNECIDIASGIYRREFRLHYAVFDAGGNQSGGGYASVETGSDMNSVNKITANVFPELVKKVCSNVSLLIK